MLSRLYKGRAKAVPLTCVCYAAVSSSQVQGDTAGEQLPYLVERKTPFGALSEQKTLL